jgi:glycogen debranching enzyme
MLDWSFKKQDFKEKHYILTSEKAFLCRHADTGFKTKWCGFWGPPLKHVEYYAYRIKSGSEQWLSWEDCASFSLNPWGAVHKFGLSEFDVTETTFIPMGRKSFISVLRIRNNGPKKKVSIVLETAVNMRRKDEDWHARTYQSEFSEVRNWIMVKTETRPWFTAFGAGKAAVPLSISFYPKGDYKEHNPGSPQRCYLPGDYEVSLDMEPAEEVEIPFIFSCSSRSMEEAISGFDSALNGWKGLLEEKMRLSGPGKQLVRTPDNEINKAFLWNSMSLRSLIHESKDGVGVLAGLPWFIEFWARDSFISLPALNHIGEFSVSRKILEMFLEMGIPSKIDTEGNMEKGFADTYPLLILALHHYAACTGDIEFLRKSKKDLLEATKGMQMADGLIVHDPEKTWMDSYQRGKSALEVQSLWSAALRHYNPELAKHLEGKIRIVYWNPSKGYFLDSKNPDSDEMTCNAIAPICLDHADGQKVSHVLDRLKEDFTTKWGVRTRSAKEKDYSPDSYHKGSVWGLTTGAAACACLKHNRVQQGLSYLKSMAAEMGENALGASAETIDADTGKLLVNGCSMQAWSSAMFITAVDEFLFGIKPELDSGAIVIHPRLPDEWDYMERFGKKIGQRSMDFMIRRDHSRLTIDANFDSSPEIVCRLVLPSNIKKAVVNGKVFTGNSFEFQMKKQNNIVALT